MNFSRKIQLEKFLAREIAPFLSLHFSAKKFGLVSIIWVKVAHGFDSAKIGVGVMRNAHQFEETARKVISKIQRELNRKLVMKKIPKIILALHRTGESLEKLEKL